MMPSCALPVEFHLRHKSYPDFLRLRSSPASWLSAHGWPVMCFLSCLQLRPLGALQYSMVFGANIYGRLISWVYRHWDCSQVNTSPTNDPLNTFKFFIILPAAIRWRQNMHDWFRASLFPGGIHSSHYMKLSSVIKILGVQKYRFLCLVVWVPWYGL